MKRALVALALALTLGSVAVVATEGASQARDTTWGCPTC